MASEEGEMKRWAGPCCWILFQLAGMIVLCILACLFALELVR